MQGPGPGAGGPGAGGGPNANPSSGLNQAGNWWNDFQNFQKSPGNPQAPIGMGAITPGSQTPFSMGAAPAGPQLGAAAPQVSNPMIGRGHSRGQQGLLGMLG